MTEGTKTHFGSRDHRITQLGLLAKRVEKALAVFAGTEVADILSDAQSVTADAVESAKALPADWKPAGRANSRKAKFVPVAGTNVKIRAKKVEQYTGVISAEDLMTLVVEAVNGKKVLVKAASGLKTLIPSSHLSARK